MSVTVQTIISCNPCGKTFAEGDASHMSAVEQRNEFRAHGWHRSAGKDFCPHCWEDWIRRPKEKQK